MDSFRSFIRTHDNLNTLIPHHHTLGSVIATTNHNNQLRNLIALVTTFILPVAVLVALQITSLPLNSASATWTARTCSITAIVLACYYWLRLIPGKSHTQGIATTSAAISVLCSLLILTNPREVTHASPQKYITETLFGTQSSPEPFLGYSNRLIVTQFKSEKKLNLKGRNLSYAVLSDADLDHVDFSGAILVGANLRGAHLNNAIFGCLNLASENTSASAETHRARAQCTNLTGADLTLAEAHNSNFFRANLTLANLEGAKLTGSNLSGAEAYGARFKNAKLMGAEIAGAKFWAADMTNTRMQGAHGYKASFKAANLSHAILHGAKLRETGFELANLDNSQLSGADITGSTLIGASIVGATFHMAVAGTMPRLAAAKIAHTADPSFFQNSVDYDRILIDATRGVKSPETVRIITQRLQRLNPNFPISKAMHFYMSATQAFLAAAEDERMQGAGKSANATPEQKAKEVDAIYNAMLADSLAHFACHKNFGKIIQRGLQANGRIRDLGSDAELYHSTLLRLNCP